jgi:hypothetical protein
MALATPAGCQAGAKFRLIQILFETPAQKISGCKKFLVASRVLTRRMLLGALFSNTSCKLQSRWIFIY